MSLVHESLVACLNRRFVCTYYDVYPGPGHDAEGLSFGRELEKHAGQSLRYGAIVTPTGDLVTSFGFARDEFVTALRQALAAHPEQNTPTPDEQAVLDAAQAAPLDAAAQLHAAQLECDLLDHAAARRRLSGLLRTDLDRVSRERVAFAHAHAGVQDLGPRDVVALRGELEQLTDLPVDLLDDRLADLASLDLVLGDADFYGGWQLRPGADSQALANSITAELARDPHGNRAGELRFMLGLCHLAAGDAAAADAVFAAHTSELPRDRYALLSRLQHSGYDFHPTNSPPRGGSLADPAVAAQIEALLASGAGLRIQGSDGRTLSGAEAAAWLKAQMGGKPVAEEPALDPGPTRDNFVHSLDTETVPLGELPPFEVIGTGPTNLILVPGLGFDAESTFGDFARRNVDLYTCHLVSLPGNGDAPSWPMPEDVTDFKSRPWINAAANAVAARAQALERPLVVGHYVVGAEIAMRAALDHPQQFRGVVCISDEPARSLSKASAAPQTLEERWLEVDQRWKPFFRTVTPERWSEGMYPPATYSRDRTRGQELWDATDRVPLPVMIRWFVEYQCSHAAAELSRLDVPMLALGPDIPASRWWDSWKGIEEHGGVLQLVVHTWSTSDSAAFPMLDVPAWFDQRMGAFVANLPR